MPVGERGLQLLDAGFRDLAVEREERDLDIRCLARLSDRYTDEINDEAVGDDDSGASALRNARTDLRNNAWALDVSPGCAEHQMHEVVLPGCAIRLAAPIFISYIMQAHVNCGITLVEARIADYGREPL
jgi:hypothetical protein